MYTIPMDPSWDYWVQQKTSKKLLWLVKNDLLPWKLTNVPWTSPVGSDVFPTEIGPKLRGRMTNVVFGGVKKNPSMASPTSRWQMNSVLPDVVTIKTMRPETQIFAGVFVLFFLAKKIVWSWSKVDDVELEDLFFVFRMVFRWWVGWAAVFWTYNWKCNDRHCSLPS